MAERAKLIKTLRRKRAKDGGQHATREREEGKRKTVQLKREVRDFLQKFYKS